MKTVLTLSLLVVVQSEAIQLVIATTIEPYTITNIAGRGVEISCESGSADCTCAITFLPDRAPPGQDQLLLRAAAEREGFLVG